MVWVRLLGVIVALAVIVLGYQWWHDRRENTALEERMHLALVTAQVWIAAAEYRQEPDRFLVWRDSLLAVEGVSADSMQLFLRRYEDRLAGYEDYARLVSYYIDSLIQERGQLPDSVLFDTADRKLLFE